jgi:phenylalanyl-tRNA synthetase beta chain
MIVPLSWINDYVKVPDLSELTERLTSIGHMLDKVKQQDGETLIDLELRGNRADMFGLLGIAREISAAFKTPLITPPTISLPKKDKLSSLVHVNNEAVDLVTRYEALHLKVKVGPSPKWLVDRLALYDLPSINNVVDVTNFVMMEYGQPLHAFDLHQLSGKRLYLRRGKRGEKFQTIAQGQEVELTKDDLVISDDKQVQALTMIGGFRSKVTNTTTEIILEAAVYQPANCRRTARRLKIFTESGLRHEKHLDPNQVEYALSRAYYLLQQVASAHAIGLVSDYYPRPVKAITIDFNFSEVNRLTGLAINTIDIVDILTRLEFKVSKSKVTVPTFRTDIQESADLVEEIARIYGYENIISQPITDAMPTPQTYSSVVLQEQLRDQLIKLGLNEVITLSMVPNDQAIGGIRLINPPDPDRAFLRTRLSPGLIDYAKRWINLHQPRVAIFELGKVYLQKGNKYQERLHLGVALAGYNDPPSWNNKSRPVNYYDLKGKIEKLQQLMGIEKLNFEITSQDGFIFSEINLDELGTWKSDQKYEVVSRFPPIVEDVNLIGNYDNLVTKITKLSPLIKQIQLVDKFEDKLTLRIVYHSKVKQLSSIDIAPIRTKIDNLQSDIN